MIKRVKEIHKDGEKIKFKRPIGFIPTNIFGGEVNGLI